MPSDPPEGQAPPGEELTPLGTLGYAAPQPTFRLLLPSAQGGIRTRHEVSVNVSQGAQAPESLDLGAKRRSAKRADASETVTTVTAADDPSGYLRFAEREDLEVQQTAGSPDCDEEL